MSGGGADPIFLRGSLLRHVSVMSFTGSIGLMAMFAVDFVDMIFISMLGNDALAAAVGYAGTILFFTNSINIGLSIAAGSLVARSLGRKERGLAREYATSVVIFGVITGLIVPVATLPFLPEILGVLGATGEVAELASSYLWIIMPTMSFMAVAIVSMAILRAHGDARRSMSATLYGAVANAALDPLLIFGVGLGLEGAAIASVIARLLMLYIAMRPVIRLYDGFAKPDLELVQRDFREVSKIANPAVLTNVATPVGAAIVMREMSKYGTDAIAGMAIVGRLTPIAFSVVFALSGAIGPIVGQNFGAGQMDRVRKAFWAGILFVSVYVGFAAAILFAVREPVAAMFHAEAATREIIYLFCGPLALAYIFNGMIFVANASFNNLGKPGNSAWINWGRNTIGTLPFVFLGSIYMGAKGVLIGQAVGGVVFGVVALVMAVRVMNDQTLEVKPVHFPRQRWVHMLQRGK